MNRNQPSELPALVPMGDKFFPVGTLYNHGSHGHSPASSQIEVWLKDKYPAAIFSTDCFMEDDSFSAVVFKPVYLNDEP